MLGISYGELFLIIGATAALIGPKDLPVIARTAGRLAGRAIGYVQMARGQFESVMQQSQARQVHKELQDTIAQLEAIRYEIRSISIMNPGPFIRRLDGIEPKPNDGSGVAKAPDGEDTPATNIPKEYISRNSIPSSLHSQAVSYARLAEAPTIKSVMLEDAGEIEKLSARDGLLAVLPVSAESAGFLPKHNDEAKGSDISEKMADSDKLGKIEI
ncbi:hypothetical protein J5N97_013151 [Dioscorea zingiberensis]|uniref:Sec-independent protein translocase protein TatB n=1 Tax=Dioscorea zingiberensis TaxID=325984 RepID=A0A9D5CRM4_9LILI|nr:hypothetical protein J5N97_013151 [Dioscorea zingiberensis]